MHGFIAFLIIGVIVLIKWIVEIPERREQQRKVNEFKKRFDEWNK